jgi:glycerol uptake facilitator-like aquaporin
MDRPNLARRSAAEAIAAWEWRDFWIYIVGPVTGAALAAFAYQAIRGPATAVPATAEFDGPTA